MIDTTPNDPKMLKPYQRGQVAHLLRTTPGAKQFSNAEPTPHPEWINVLDAGCRAAKPSNGYGPDAECFVPLAAYGLDDDPPRQKEGVVARVQAMKTYLSGIEETQIRAMHIGSGAAKFTVVKGFLPV